MSEDPKYQNYVDPYYTLVGYFNSIRELGGAVRLLDDDINSRLKVLRKKYKKMEKGGVTVNEENRRIKGNYRRWRV